MLRLNLKREPYWIDLPAGVRLFVRPLSTAIMSAAQAVVVKDLALLKEKEKEEEKNKEEGSMKKENSALDSNTDWRSRSESEIKIESESEEASLGLLESLLIKALARNAIIKWEGVLEADEPCEAIAPVVDRCVNDLMDIWFIAQDFWKNYTSSLVALEQEGNSSGLAVNGTLAAGPVTVELAKRKISHVAKVREVR